MNTQNVHCSCLNFHLEIQQTNSIKEINRAINKEVMGILEDPLFSKATISAHKINYNLLSSQTKIGDWILYKCLNCNSVVFAIDQTNPRDYLINKKFIKNKTDLETIITNKNYSKTFKIILPKETTKTERDKIGKEEKKNNEQFEKEFNKLDQLMKQILGQEKEKMKQELENFKQTQQKKFEQFKLNVENEKQNLWNNILMSQNLKNKLEITTNKPKSVENIEKEKEKVQETEKETETFREQEKEKQTRTKTIQKDNNTKKKSPLLVRKSIKQRPQKNKKLAKNLHKPQTIEMKGKKIIFKQNYNGLNDNKRNKKSNKKQRTKKFKKKFDEYESNYIPYFNFSMEDNEFFNKKFDKFNSDEEKEDNTGNDDEEDDDDDDEDEDEKRFNEIFSKVDNIKSTPKKQSKNKKQNEKDELGNIARSVPIPIFLNQVMEREMISPTDNKNDGFIEPHKYIQAQQSQTELDLSKSFNVPLKRVPTWRIANSVSAFRSNIFEN
ncbi:akt1 substrate 1 protein [Anaeramoeba flamelloides]|uniref:Akt1 substrate 1 protein n=1 Tax=Anaeramoeba flamelloides TaxID=1746091 RepID=A0ABQ8Y9V7_9EUKA|nr:akt1 substrate 1 protein [Anaeramoeba flamelloides]